MSSDSSLMTRQTTRSRVIKNTSKIVVALFGKCVIASIFNVLPDIISTIVADKRWTLTVTESATLNLSETKIE